MRGALTFKSNTRRREPLTVPLNLHPGGLPLYLLLVPLLSTLAGGFLALRLRRHLALLMAFGTGLLLGAALLDLLPEAFVQARPAGIPAHTVLIWTGLALLLFHALGRLIKHLEIGWSHRAPTHSILHRAGALMLISHSFRDGIAIGAAFSASHAAGYAVALGIAAHDLGDGINTVILTTRGNRATRIDYAFLAADALAPVLGGLSTAWFVWSTRGSVIVLTLATGFFLAMVLGDFLPELRRYPAARTLLLPTLLAGIVFIAAANFLLAHLLGWGG